VAAVAGTLALGAGALGACSPALAAVPRPRLSATAAILIEQSTGQRLYGYNAFREQPIASTTKLMTALVTLEHEPHLSKIFVAPNYHAAAADSQIGLVPGERMSVHDLLLALILPSADDAAEDLAYNVGHGSVARFIEMMNTRAHQLGLKRTHYTTPIGLDTPGNYSTAADLVRLAGYDLTHSAYFARIVAQTHAVLRTGSRERYVLNRNDLVAKYPWINGVKTGHTAGAGYVLVASAHRAGMTLLSAVLGTSSEASRDANTMALLDYGFATFRLATAVHAGQVLARPSVRYRSGERAALIARSALRRVVARGQRLSIVVHAPQRLTGPIRRGAVVGTAVVFAGRHEIGRVALSLARALPAVSKLAIATGFVTQPIVLLALAILAGGLTALACLARRRRRARAGNGELEAA
jgi:D-alanyl-D-alanine carboxypeptidase (penicillin-binding protein 5/6)